MTKVNPHRAMISWLKQCDRLNRRLYFVFGEALEEAKVFFPVQDQRYERKDITGTELRYCTMAIADYRKYSAAPIPLPAGYAQENMDDMDDVQAIIDWVNDQDRLRNHPDFGEGASVETVYTMMASPGVAGHDNKTKTAQYMLTVRAEYLVRSEENA